MKTYLKTGLTAAALSMGLIGAAFSAASVDELQKAVTAVEGAGHVRVVSFVDGVVTLNGSVSEGIDISTIKDALLEFDDVKKFVSEVIINN